MIPRTFPARDHRRAGAPTSRDTDAVQEVLRDYARLGFSTGDAQYHSPSAKETFTVLAGCDPDPWLELHPDAVLIYSRE